MSSKRLERIGSIFWGIVFGAMGIGCVYALIVSGHDGWTAWDWIWRSGGILLLFAASVGGFLPDLTAKEAVDWEQESTAAHLEIDGFTTTYDRNPYLQDAIEGLASFDPGPAHTLFHTSRAGAWGLRFLIVRLLHDRYADRWAAISARSMMNGLVERTHRDPCWVLLRAYWQVKLRHFQTAVLDCNTAAGRDPEDPTPYVMELFALRARGSGRSVQANARRAYAEALRRAPLLYEAHEQMAHVLAAGGDSDEVLGFARSVARTAPEGTDEAFLPALAHRIVYARMALRKPEAARRYLAARDVAEEIALACRRSFDSPHYRTTHRTARLLHTAAGLHSVIGDEARLHGELARAGKTFDLDLWNPFHPSYPAKAFLKAHRRSQP